MKSRIGGLVIVVALAFVALTALPQCGGVNLGLTGSGSGSGSGSGLGDLANAAAGCPNLGSVDAIAKVNFAKEFGLDVKASAKLKSALKASAELEGISKELKAELKTACGGLARDLGADPGNSAKSACNAASKAIGDLKAKAGGKLTLAFVPPKCEASLDIMGKCAADCDASIDPGKVDVKCEGGELSGKCDAQCSGSCSMDAGAVCKGTCSGECTAQFSGECAGECNGKCAGKATNGAASCEGKCEGSCSAGASGSCGGSCKGECKFKAAAKCEGQCTGGCSVEMKAPKCTGDVKPPEMSAECKAECDAKVSGKLECKKPRVTVKISGAADAAAAGKLKAALEANLPGVLKVAIGMKGKLVKAAGSVKTVVEGVKGSIGGMAKGGAGAAARLTACVADPFKGAFDAAASIKANVEVSVDVQASASGSAGTN